MEYSEYKKAIAQTAGVSVARLERMIANGYALTYSAEELRWDVKNGNAEYIEEAIASDAKELRDVVASGEMVIVEDFHRCENGKLHNYCTCKTVKIK